ncbi:unnamed protein product [Rotaria sp. Silwood2]|nr:unnamed protein product [Rotaria sp. Silwood2]CAF2776949.1 unnamed protein product [Rotaria sp. Silwood2]CAF3013990.1 unnamed protein product [Rotaria sp. Silwood2]CAF3178682.1 unnamed protein product [Rotaria sp. Silwood2]CAF3890249.1 unnamed protein product [Rotaria sp. Silwood2]
MIVIIISIIILYLTYCLYQHFFSSSKINPKGKYVLISGCDTGIGHALAMKLDQLGFNVFVGVLIPDNSALLKAKLSSRATVFRLDITKQEDIDAAYNLVKKTTNTLHALVNNAGILTHGCIDWTSMEIMRKLMDVNFFGHVAMTKKLLPLLIAKCDSRIVNVVSAAGFFTFPNTSAYSASKYALKSFSDCLRREMASWNLRVSIIEPGALRTPMMERYEDTLRNVWNGLPSDVQERWGIDYLNGIITKAINSPFMINADNPSRVVRAVQHAVMNPKPRIHYRPGWQAKVIFYIFYLAPTWLSDKLLVKAINFVPSGVQSQLLN